MLQNVLRSFFEAGILSSGGIGFFAAERKSGATDSSYAHRGRSSAGTEKNKTIHMYGIPCLRLLHASLCKGGISCN